MGKIKKCQVLFLLKKIKSTFYGAIFAQNRTP